MDIVGFRPMVSSFIVGQTVTASQCLYGKLNVECV